MPPPKYSSLRSGRRSAAFLTSLQSPARIILQDEGCSSHWHGFASVFDIRRSLGVCGHVLCSSTIYFMRRHAFMRAQIRGIGFYKLSVVSLRVDIRSPLPCNRCVPCDRRTGCRASAKTQPASSSILSSTPEETKGRARFNTFEDAIAWNTKVVIFFDSTAAIFRLQLLTKI